MNDRDETDDKKTKTSEEPQRDPTKSSGQDVGPPGERVDDEVGSDEKTTKRQE